MDPEKRTIVSRPAQLENLSRPPVHQPALPTMVPYEESHSNTNAQHVLFCQMIGLPINYETQPYPSIWKSPSQKTRKYKGLYPRVRSAYRWHTFQYWLVATISNSLLWMQICFGAALTALGGTKSDRVSVAIIVLGAIQTVFGGLTTYFKSRNQPNRARQFRAGLKQVLDAIENSESLLRDPAYRAPPYMPLTTNVGNTSLNAQEAWLGGARSEVVTGVEGMVLRLMDMYMQAVREAEVNYPDFWLVNRRDNNQEQLLIMRDLMQELRRTGALQEVGHVGDGKTTGSGLSQMPTGASAHFGVQSPGGIGVAGGHADGVSRSGTMFSGHQAV